MLIPNTRSNLLSLRAYRHLLGIALFLIGGIAFASDDAAFHIECPPDVTLDCTDEIWDLSDYGWAYVYGYGSPVPAPPPVVHYNLNNCNTGVITRTWTAYDYGGYPYSCTQHIYVTNNYGGFNYHDIHWPPDYMTTDCHQSLEPEHLPYPYNYPWWYDQECSMPMKTYEDWVFDFGGGCVKILRKWKVIDWCTYEPNNPYNTGGYWEYTQVLKIKPTYQPVIHCPYDVTVSADGNCTGAYVDLPPATATGACYGEVDIHNNSPYAHHGGADASGFYPLGTTKVTFKAEDGCGNHAKCHVYITVKDLKKPSPVCISGVTANLMIQPDGSYNITIQGEWFDAGSFDNCTPASYLKFDVEPKFFTCEDLGNNNVKVYVEDLSGNRQFCNTYVDIQDNMGMCPPDTSTYPLSGLVMDEMGEPLSDVRMILQGGSDLLEALTDQDGLFEFEHIMNGEDYIIVADVNENYRDGLSTRDMLIISKYLLGLIDLENSYKFLAADIDMNGVLDIRDISELRSLLLYNTDEYYHGHAWRFINADQPLGQGEDALSQWLPGFIEVFELDTASRGNDFYGVKLGDMDHSAASDGSVSGRNLDRFDLTTSAVDFNAGDEVAVRFIVEREQLLEGIQFGMYFNANVLEIVDIAAPGWSGFNDHSYTIDNDRGELLLSYVNGSGLLMEPGQTVLELRFKAKAAGELSRELQLADHRLTSELYAGEETMALGLKFIDENSPETEVIAKEVSIFPNPFSTEVNIYIQRSSELSGNASYRLSEMSGRLLLEGSFSGGSLSLSRDRFTASGIYLLELDYDGRRTVHKLVLD